MEKNLVFNETLTVEQFKSRTQVSKVNVMQNPHTGKLFFSFGNQTGAVALAGIPKNPVFSHVSTPEGESFWLLHEEGTGEAPVVATF